MAGSTFGKLYRVTTFGESHGDALGAIIDGCPSGLDLSEEDIQVFLNRRKPGETPFSTKRKESDRCRILSGIYKGRTTGTPISVQVENTDARSADYGELENCYRPGHADFTYDEKYGFRDPRGGGRSSGRETIGRVIGGAVAAKVLSAFGIRAAAYTQSIGKIMASPEHFSLESCRENPLWMPDAEAVQKAEAYLKGLISEKDSAGGVIGCIVSGMPSGLGEPVFDKLDAEIAKAVMSIGAVKGVEFGAGFAAAFMKGSENNDAFLSKTGKDGKTKIGKKTNHAGGVLGGISDGSVILFQTAVKPTPSIAKKQETVDNTGKETGLEIRGRHDPVIVPRAVVVVECMTNIVLLDMLLRNTSVRMDYLKKIYG